uniref:F-box/LRR-repeat protein 15/At3g58940/PEG3-like LRR domain-containing protein n=1 Tax=Rhizophora mucronata TaxID=61149 RepID=A0A2P2JBT5_RHIMU
MKSHMCAVLSINFRSLAILQLEMICALSVPSVICLPNLKELWLIDCIEFLDDHSVQCLLSGCQYLQKLFLHNCKWKSVNTVCLSSPMLEESFVAKLFDDEINYCQFVIYGINLNPLCVGVNFLKIGYFIHSSSVCIDVGEKVNIEEEEREGEVIYHLQKLQWGFCNL